MTRGFEPAKVSNINGQSIYYQVDHSVTVAVVSTSTTFYVQLLLLYISET